MGGLDKLMERLKELLEEQKERHEGGSKWIGTDGTSPVRQRRLQPGGHPHRRPVRGQPHRGQGLGAARLPRLRRPGRTGHAQHQGRAAPPAQVRARGRRGGTRPRRHDRLHRAQRRLPRHPDASRAAQHDQGADAARRRRHDGRPHQADRGTVLGRQDRIQAPRVLLLPQLRLRLRVEEQPPAPCRALRDLGHPAQVQPRLPARSSSATRR